MATNPLTDVEKAQLRSFLGYPNMFRYKNPRLESAMDGLDDAVLTLVRGAMAKVLSIDDLLNTDGLDAAGVKKVDNEVEFFGRSGAYGGESRVDGIRKMGRMHIARISKILGTPINNGSDYFDPNGYAGDHWSSQMGNQRSTRSVSIEIG